MEIRRAVKEDLPQINQLITDHPESFVKVKRQLNYMIGINY